MHQLKISNLTSSEFQILHLIMSSYLGVGKNVCIYSEESGFYFSIL